MKEKNYLIKILLDLIETLILNNINQFTIFTAFIDRLKFLDSNLIRNVGWLSDQTTNKQQLNSIEDVTKTLQLFEQFINRLINIYYLTNSIQIRTFVIFIKFL